MNNCNDIADMSETKNFWLVEMLPFNLDDRKNDKFVNEYQQLCIRNKIFGIGWSDFSELKEIFGQIIVEKSELTNEVCEQIKKNIKKFSKFKNNEEVNNNIENIYQNLWKKLVNKDNNGLKLAINNFFSIEKGDIVLSRLRNGKYIVGRVKDNEKYYGTNRKKIKDTDENEDELIRRWSENEKEKVTSKGFGWRCEVENWYVSSRTDIPSDIIGRCSQRNSSTITRICDDRIKLFILKLLEKEEDKKKSSCPPISLNANNFVTALNDDELEDLVYLYILKEKEKNNNLILLPSQCKISEPMYEFYLQDKDKKYITCQVKNRKGVEFSIYKDEIDYDKKKKCLKRYIFFQV